MPRIALTILLLIAFTAHARGPAKTEVVTGDGFVWATLGRSVELAIDVSQLDPAAPTGEFAAMFFSFPGHLVLTFESTSIDDVAVDRRTGMVTGSGTVLDTISGAEHVVDFHVQFEDLAAGRHKNRNDTMSLTLFLPDGAQNWSGLLFSGDIEVGEQK